MVIAKMIMISINVCDMLSSDYTNLIFMEILEFKI